MKRSREDGLTEGNTSCGERVVGIAYAGMRRCFLPVDSRPPRPPPRAKSSTRRQPSASSQSDRALAWHFRVNHVGAAAFAFAQTLRKYSVSPSAQASNRLPQSSDRPCLALCVSPSFCPWPCLHEPTSARNSRRSAYSLIYNGASAAAKRLWIASSAVLHSALQPILGAVYDGLAP